ncbi:MAG: 3-hydroxyacyl-CoA dehydrogenase family protein [Massiliimalia sp.]|jgi:carnitine 3-dehydrogenase
MNETKTVASISCGVIGYSWALKFAMGGYQVFAQNRTSASSETARTRIEESMQSLQKNGVLTEEKMNEIRNRIHYTTSIQEAVSHAFFIQESSSEHYDIKHELVKEIEEYAPENAVIASSTSGLLISEIAKYAKHPERFVGGHPYNPPHLIPLVEITKGDKTADWAVTQAKEFYQSIGNEPVVLQKEALGFICNRLQMALYREICHLVMSGVCSVEDADKAVTFGPGIRWGIMGPSLVFELGGGEHGVSGLVKHLNDSISLWLQDMADWKEFPKEWAEIAQKGVNEELLHRDPKIGNTHASLEEYRDQMLIELLKLHHKL